MRKPPSRLASARGGLTTQARHGNEVPARAHRGLRQKFLDQVDPTLPAEERERRAALLFRAHMLRLAEASAAARRR